MYFVSAFRKKKRKGNKQTIMVDYKTAIKRTEIKLQHAGTLKKINSKKSLNLFLFGLKNKSGRKKKRQKKKSHKLPEKRYYGRKGLMNTLRMC